ncbi:MAG: cyclase family protein [Actinobacteria bacterium]|nr:cyclase family protein [Actinomycetota bacterium]
MHDWAGRHHDLTTSFPPSGASRVYDLAVRLEVGMTRHPAHPPYAFTLTKEHGDFPYGNGITAVSEAFTMGAHVGTHVDALGHVAYCGEIHGGIEIAGRHSLAGGLEVGSAEEIPPLIAPGHLVDAEELFGRELTIEDDIGAAELSAWFDEHPAPGPGSIVLIRTGWMKYWADANKYIGIQIGLPGLTLEGAEWLSERGVLAVGSDTMNLERKRAAVVCLDVHRHLLVERGIYIMESLQLEQAAADGVRDLTFFAVPLRLKGATGSPLRPLAVTSG